MTASGDHNIHLHLLATGSFIGQFGQRSLWNIYDISKYFYEKPLKPVIIKARKPKQKMKVKTVAFQLEESKEASPVKSKPSPEKKPMPEELMG